MRVRISAEGDVSCVSLHTEADHRLFPAVGQDPVVEEENPPAERQNGEIELERELFPWSVLVHTADGIGEVGAYSFLSLTGNSHYYSLF